MIEIKNLNKKFGKVEVLKDLDLTISTEPSQGRTYAVLGPNGSGKTTLIKCILGMVIPDKGTIDINGKSVLKKYLYRQKINYLPQIANFPSNLRVQELFSMVKNLREKPVDETTLVNSFGLNQFLDKKLGNLSGGTKQKVNIVLSFMFDSPLIILDEPTTGLDPISLLNLKKIISAEKDRGKTILITSHIMSFVEEISDEIIFLLDGKIYFKGTLESLKEKTKQSNLERAIAEILTDEYV